tara:strand:- start:177 stop:500 length:324 start_codon:yes stop_codon:yes gene_type:complete
MFDDEEFGGEAYQRATAAWGPLVGNLEYYHLRHGFTSTDFWKSMTMEEFNALYEPPSDTYHKSVDKNKGRIILTAFAVLNNRIDALEEKLKTLEDVDYTMGRLSLDE